MKPLKIVVFILAAFHAHAQENKVDKNVLGDYHHGSTLFDYNLYGGARYPLQLFAEQQRPAPEDDFANLKDEALAMAAISGLRADLMSGEQELVAFINHKYPDPVTIPAILELGSYYFNKKWYQRCIETYDMVQLDRLSTDEMAEASLKKGYALFVTKEFMLARHELDRTRDIRGDFYYPTNYYYGMCEYFLGSYGGAIASFDLVKNHETYKSFIPYNLVQIYAAQHQDDKVIQYGEGALNDKQLRNRKEIRLILGQAYFRQEKYEQALPHLAYYEDNSEKLTTEEFYQLGFSHYKLGNYPQAIPHFKELSLLDSRLGQLVNHYLADCYNKTGDKLSARTAFKKVSQMDYEPNLRDEALINYAKLSAESGYEREAINTLLKIDTSNPYYAEAQDILVNLLENTSDYATGLQIIENMTTVNEKMKVVYQSLALKYGIQLYNDDIKDAAYANFIKANQYQASRITASQGLYWAAMVKHESQEYEASNALLTTYFKTSSDITWMPDESTQAMAYYTQGYNYFKQQQYSDAEKAFTQTHALIQAQLSKIKNKQISEVVWPDAIVRIGDCQFKRKQYKDAVKTYDQVVQKKQGPYIYAMYQRGMLEGLLDEPYQKIVTLRNLKLQHPKSEYADDALLQLGDTYAEVENFENAYQTYQELTAQYKTSPYVNEAHLKIGLIAYNKGDLNTAITHYKAVMANNPSARESESALLGLQEIYINDLGKSDEYVAYVSTIPGYNVTASTADSLAYMVGNLRYNDGEYEKAITGFSNYLDKYPNGANRLSATYYRAESYSILKKYNLALADYEKTVQAGTSEFYIQAIRKSALIAYNSTQEFDKAFKYYDLYYQKITDEDEKYKAALGALRSAFRISNSDAIKQYGHMVTTDKRADKDEQASAWYYLAKTYMRENDMPQATQAFKQVSTMTDNNQAAESRYMLAEILYKQGKIKDAEAQCNLANEQNAAYPYWIAKSLILLSDIYVDRQDLFNARAALEAIIENFQGDKELLGEAQSRLDLIGQLEKQQSRIKPEATEHDTLEMLKP
ncbi:MAG: tetratricopeptide repeat protein [Chitinophagales bacterium]|nr:tetratricopeptide repeat protein [Chitinophagales bacterium]